MKNIKTHGHVRATGMGKLGKLSTWVLRGAIVDGDVGKRAK